MMLEPSLTNEIAAQLDKAGLKYDTRTALGGIRPDFVVEGPNDGVIVIEAKAWEPKSGLTKRAARQADYITEQLGANNTLMVLPELQRNQPSKGVVNLDGLMPAIDAAIEKLMQEPNTKRPNLYAVDRTVFAAMPFKEIYDDTLKVAMIPAAESIQAVCERVDHQLFSGDIMEMVKKMIEGATAVIVDLSEARPNVLYEAGYAHGRDKPTIQICSTPLDKMPFDLRGRQTIPYEIGRTTRLRPKLITGLNALVPPDN